VAKEQGGPAGFQMSDPEDQPSGPEKPGVQIDFATLILSLSASALAHLGVADESEEGPPPEVNLPLARQTIDVLELLQRKTRGNLDEAEQRLLASMIHDLRLRYVAARSA
jgi:hypothetical protein